DQPGFFTSMYNRIFRRKKHLDAKIAETQKLLQEEADELQKQAEQDIKDLGDRIDQALKEKSDKIINDLAVDFCKYCIVGDPWEVFIQPTIENVTDTTSTKSTMDGTIAELSNFLFDLGVAEGTDQETLEDALKAYRFQWRQNYSTANGYPIQSEHTIWLGNTVVIEFYGKIHFDLQTRQILFQMDELKVLGVKVDLEQVMANATEAVEEETLADSL
ncbi:MAG: hypothetical protein SGILL_010376, partial [Bacillariaceae sp.]